MTAKAIMTCVLAKPMKVGDVAHTEGEIVHLDEDTAKNLISAGMVREATDDDLMGDDEEEEGDDAEEVRDEEPVTNAVRRLAANNEATLVKATEKVAEKLVKASRVQPNMGRHVAGSDEERTGGFKSVGDFVLNRMSAKENDRQAVKRVERFKTLVATKFSPPAAGISGSPNNSDLVPIQWAEDLWKLSFEDVPDLLGMMRKYDMKYQKQEIPSYVQPSAADSLSADVTDEGDAITPTVPVSGNAELFLKKGTALVNVTDELLRFSPYMVENLIKQVVPERIRYLTNNSVVNGTNSGVNLIGNASAVVVAASNPGRIEYIDVANMEAALFGSFDNGAAWFTNKATIPELMTIGFPTRSASFQTPAWTPGNFGNLLGPKPRMELMGRPVWTLENFPLKGTKGALVLANVKSLAAGYSGLIGDQTPYLYFNQAINTWRFLFYFNSVNPLTVPYTRQFGGNASNIVVLSATSVGS